MMKWHHPFWGMLMICQLFHLNGLSAQAPLASPSDTVFIPVRPLYHTGPLLGLHALQPAYIELGLTSVGIGHGVVGWDLSALRSLESERAIWGVSGGYFAAFAYFEWGIRGTVMTNFAQTEAYIKPYVGLGIGGILTVQYGLNIPLMKRQPDPFARIHVVSLLGRWPIGM